MSNNKIIKPLASQVLAEVRQIIQGKYLVGHAIEHDLLVLEHFGPPFQGIRDTSQYLRWKGKKISLKKAAQHYLQKTIQSGKDRFLHRVERCIVFFCHFIAMEHTV